MKTALNTREPRIICPTLKILQQMILLSPMVGQALVPYYRQVRVGTLVFFSSRKRVGGCVSGMVGATRTEMPPMSAYLAESAQYTPTHTRFGSAQPSRREWRRGCRMQLLPVFNLFRGKNSNMGDAIDYNQRSRTNLGELIMETLEVGGGAGAVCQRYMYNFSASHLEPRQHWKRLSRRASNVSGLDYSLQI